MDINKTKLHYRTLCVGQCIASFWNVVGAARGSLLGLAAGPYLTSFGSFWKHRSVLPGKKNRLIKPLLSETEIATHVHH